MSKDSISVHSPAGDLSDGWGVGGGSQPAGISIYPDVDMTGASGMTAVGSKPAENFGMMGETVSPGTGAGVQLAIAPEEPSADLGNQLAGGLGDIPTPSGSY